MKTVCVYHSIDLDGWMSAAIVKYYYDSLATIKSRRKGFNSLRNDNLDFIGYNYGDLIPDLSEYDSVIMVDISFPKEEMRKLFETKHHFTWIDHHISAIKEVGRIIPMVFTEEVSVKHAACELTWKYFFPDEEMPEIVRLLGRYDCFGHKGTGEEQRVLEFQYGARSVIGSYKAAYSWLVSTLAPPSYGDPNDKDVYSILQLGKAIYSYLCTEAKQAYKKGFNIILQEDNWFESGTIIGIMTDGSWKNRKFICFNKERFNPINFGIDYHKDGYDGAACFHYADGIWKFSLYNDNDEVDVSQIAKQFGGGGHKGAAGFVIENLNDIIK